MPILNRAINSLNTDVDVVSPWLGATVHAIIHHHLHHKYLGLGDGLHPTEELRAIWVNSFVSTILKNYAWRD